MKGRIPNPLKQPVIRFQYFKSSVPEFFDGISCLKFHEFISNPQLLLNDARQSLEFSTEEKVRLNSYKFRRQRD